MSHPDITDSLRGLSGYFAGLRLLVESEPGLILNLPTAEATPIAELQPAFDVPLNAMAEPVGNQLGTL